MEGLMGQVMLFGGSFAPRNWAFCDGSLLQIAQYQALFAILGTTYGGDGRTTFALPDLRGRVAISPGQGPGLSGYALGQRGGTETVTLTTAELPSHSHLVGCSDQLAAVGSPVGSVWGREEHGAVDIYQNAAPDGDLSTAWLQQNGGGGAHNNMAPYLPLQFIICIVGSFPSRN